MTKPISRDPIYRRRRFEAEIIELCVRWYNHEHRHGGIGLMAPSAVHDGIAVALTAQRAVTLDAAYAAHPVRFKGRSPKPPLLPTAAWINPPKKESSPTTITYARTLIS
jgi:hypothetical protein